MSLAQRFRGYLPIIIDIETGGFNPAVNPLLELAAVSISLDDQGLAHTDDSYHCHINAFEHSVIEPSALAFNGIDPDCALRGAVDEKVALSELSRWAKSKQKSAGCQRCVVVAHNAAFDNGFLTAAAERQQLKRSAFHPFVTFDTATLAAFTLGQTVLAKACKAAKLDFDQAQAHGALYDAQKTAELFCWMINRYQSLGGWPPPL